LRRSCLSETPSEARGDRARAVGGRRTAGNPVDSAGSGRASRRSRRSVATRPHRPSGSRGEKRPSRRTIPEEESGTADLTLPVVGNDGAVRRLAGPPQLAPSPVGAAPAVLANPWPYGLMRSVSAASLSDVGCRVGDGGRAPQFAVPRGFGMKPTDTRVVQRTPGRERIDGRRTTLNLSSSSEFAGTTIPHPPRQPRSRISVRGPAAVSGWVDPAACHGLERRETASVPSRWSNTCPPSVPPFPEFAF